MPGAGRVSPLERRSRLLLRAYPPHTGGSAVRRSSARFSKRHPLAPRSGHWQSGCCGASRRRGPAPVSCTPPGSRRSRRPCAGRRQPGTPAGRSRSRPRSGGPGQPSRGRRSCRCGRTRSGWRARPIGPCPPPIRALRPAARRPAGSLPTSGPAASGTDRSRRRWTAQRRRIVSGRSTAAPSSSPPFSSAWYSRARSLRGGGHAGRRDNRLPGRAPVDHQPASATRRAAAGHRNLPVPLPGGRPR